MRGYLYLSLAALLWCSSSAHAQHNVEAPPLEDTPMTYDYVVVPDSFVMTDDAIAFEQLHSDANVGSVLYDRYSGRVQFALGNIYLESTITPNDLQRNRGKPKPPGKGGLLWDLISLGMSNRGASEEEKQATAGAVAENACTLNRIASNQTIQIAVQSCAAGGGTFRMISSGDACGAGASWTCEMRTGSDPIGF